MLYLKMKRVLVLQVFIILLTTCNQQNQKNEDAVTLQQITADYRNTGDSIAALAQRVLLSNVSSAMQNGGPANAVDFCHIHASDITDSLSNSMNVTIERISFKNRNPKNAPVTSEDSLALNYFASALEQNLNLKDTIFTSALQTLYYKPIAIALPACLKCHGKTGQDIDAKTAAILQSKYPEDKAKEYKMGDLRGAWKITFEK